MNNRLLPSQIFFDLLREGVDRPTGATKVIYTHKWIIGIRKRRQAGYMNALVLHPKRKVERQRKRAIAKARFKTKLHELSK